MAVPTVIDIRVELEGYGITTSVLSDNWIERCRDYEIIPHVKRITKMDFNSEQEITEYYNGNGTSILILNRRPVNEIVSIQVISSLTVGNLLAATLLISNEGIVKARTDYDEGIYGPIFQKGYKNIQVTYKYGYDDYPDDIARAIILMVAAKALALIGARTGGGSLSVQSHSRNYGSHGKYTDIRKEFIYGAYSILNRFQTGVVGA